MELDVSTLADQVAAAAATLMPLIMVEERDRHNLSGPRPRTFEQKLQFSRLPKFSELALTHIICCVETHS